jgi:hypothetical protein
MSLAYITHFTLSHPKIYTRTHWHLIRFATTAVLVVAEHYLNLKRMTCVAQQLMHLHHTYQAATFQGLIGEFAKACHVLTERCWELEEMKVEWRKKAEWGGVDVSRSLCKGRWKGVM